VARSTLHLKTREILLEKYPTLTICEECPITLRRGEIAYIDFYLPLLKIAIEVNGEQHFKYIPHFHGSAQVFLRAKKRDRDKAEWCERNGIKLVNLNYNEDIEEWKTKI